MGTEKIKRLRTLVEAGTEIFLEWIEYLNGIFRRGSNGSRHLSEEYSMKKEYMDEEYIKEFLQERERSIARYGYRMLLNSNYVSEKSEEIGIVILRSKGRYIDHATLTVGPTTANGNRIIYWIFDKGQ